MKLQFRIREIAQSKGIDTAYKLQKRANLSPATAYRLFNNQTRQITLASMEKICIALECEPGELFAEISLVLV